MRDILNVEPYSNYVHVGVYYVYTLRAGRSQKVNSEGEVSA